MKGLSQFRNTEYWRCLVCREFIQHDEAHVFVNSGDPGPDLGRETELPAHRRCVAYLYDQNLITLHQHRLRQFASGTFEP